MNKGRDKFRRFARGRHRKGKIMRLAMIFLPLLLLFSMCSAFMGHGGHRGHRNGRSGGFHQTEHGEFNRDTKGCRAHHCGMEESSSTTAAAATVSSGIAQANVQNEDQTLDELTIIQDTLQRALVGEDITSEQYNRIMAQETLRFTEKKENEQKNEEAAPAASSNDENSSNQAGPQPQTGRESRNHHRRRGFSPIGFLIGGLFKLGLLFFLLSFIARRFGFRPWRQSLGFRRWQQAYADAWGTPVSEETPVAPEEEHEDDDIARELEREEQKQQAQQKKAKEDQAAQPEEDDESSDNSDKNQTDDKNAA